VLKRASLAEVPRWHRGTTKLRHILLDHAELKRELEELRNQTDERFQIVFTVLDKLVNEGEEENRKTGLSSRKN